MWQRIRVETADRATRETFTVGYVYMFISGKLGKVRREDTVSSPAFTEPTVLFSGLLILARYSARFSLFSTPVFRHTLTCAVIE